MELTFDGKVGFNMGRLGDCQVRKANKELRKQKRMKRNTQLGRRR
jgi:hypothetical protein